MRGHNVLASLVLLWSTTCVLWARPAFAIPVFARLYNKPCSACHTVYPQLNPAGEDFRAHGLHGFTPLVDQLRQGKEIEVVWDCLAPPPTIETDALRLEQVLTNLITNAFKFTSRGAITIRARSDAARERVVFVVADTGIGIPEHELLHIFDEFRQVDGSMSRAYGGMGLGLALVRKLTSLLQGEITVASQVGQGSVFTVTLPLRSAP